MCLSVFAFLVLCFMCGGVLMEDCCSSGAERVCAASGALPDMSGRNSSFSSFDEVRWWFRMQCKFYTCQNECFVCYGVQMALSNNKIYRAKKFFSILAVAFFNLLNRGIFRNLAFDNFFPRYMEYH